jgi:hypothetical protein
MKQPRRGSHQEETDTDDCSDYRNLPKFKAYVERVRLFIESCSPVTYGDLNRECGASDYLTEALDGLITDGLIRRIESNPQITMFVYSGTAIMPEAKWTLEQRKRELANLFSQRDGGLYEY